jgi:hypothetical protein
MIDDSDVKQQMTIVENGVNYNIKRYNDLKVLNGRLTKVLKAKLDELENEKKTFENLDAMKKAQTEEGMRIESLHNEVKQVEEEIRDRVHYSRKLDHMLTRLKKNQLKYDAHMTGLEDTMRAIKKEEAEIRLMRRSLDAGLAKAMLVLEETRSSLQVARTDRKVLMEQRDHEYENAIILEQWLKTRERMKIELGIELRGDLTVEDEKFLKSQIDQREERSKLLAKEAQECQKKLQEMEASFTRLKQVTGVKNVEEMHEKFFNQKTNKFQLVEKDVPEMKKRVEEAKNAYLKVENDFKSIKSSGIGLEEVTRDSIDTLKSMSHEAKIDQKAINADSERIASVLLGLSQGSQGLLQRVQPYQYLTEGGVFDLTQVGEEASPWTETVEALNTAEHILSKMMEVITGDANNAAAGFDDDDEEEDEDNRSQFSDIDLLDSTSIEAPNIALNVRVKSRKYLRHFEASDDDGAGVMMTGDNMLDTLDTPVANNGETDTGANYPSANSRHHHLVSDVTPDEDANKARLTMKLALDKEKRGMEAERRRKKLLERLETAKGDEEKPGNSRRKQQKDWATKMSVIHKVPTLPEGVTLRDDPMTKTVAFLKADPGLA